MLPPVKRYPNPEDGGGHAAVPGAGAANGPEPGPPGAAAELPSVREHTWRRLDTGFAGGARNMAVDEAILQQHAAGAVPPTLRFYGWQPPAVSIGYFQSMAGEVDRDACRRLGIGWVRRPTGGWAILHHMELTYSVVVREELLPGGVLETYRALAQGLLTGLRSLGAPAELSALPAAHPAEMNTSACFEHPSQYELVVGGRKLVGSAQTRKQGTILQHGAILLDIDYDLTFAVLRLSPEERTRQAALLRRRAVGLQEALGRRVTWEEARDAVAAGFAQALGLRLQTSELIAPELAGVQVLEREKYGNPEWNERK